MKRRISFIYFITLIFSLGWLADTQAMQKIGQKMGKAFLGGLSGDMSEEDHKRLAQIYTRALGQEIQQGLTTGLANGVGQGAGQAVNNLWQATNQAFQQNAQGQQGQGRQAVDNFFKAIGTGSGQLVKEVGNHFEKGGEVGKAFEKMGAQFKEGGELSNALADTSTGFNRDFLDRILNNLHGHGFKAAGIAILAAGGTSAAFYGAKTFWEYVKKEFKKPAVVLETSKPSFIERIRNIFSKKEKDLRPMVFAPELETRLNNISAATTMISKKIKAGKKNVKYRNLLLYGPPGTGKTMFAKQLAYKSGMEYVFMTGASFAEKGAIEVMNDLFKWAERSKKPVMFFVDEADALLANREKLKVDGNAIRAINHFLNFTGTRNKNFMCVFATNRKHVIDPAMRSRIDDEVEVTLPGFEERVRVLKVYRNLVLGNVKENGNQFVQTANRVFNDEKINEIAHRADGFCNRDLEGIVNMIKTDADITQSGMVTQAIVDTAVERMIEKHQVIPSV